MILNRGDVPNIFPNDERLEIIEKVGTSMITNLLLIICEVYNLML